MKPLALMAVVLSVSLSAGSSIARSPARKPQPGYQCALDQHGAFGIISSSFRIPAGGGSFGAFISWDPGDGTFRNPWVTAAFFRQPDGRFSLDYGYVSIMSHIWERRLGKRPRPLTLMLELGTSISPAMAHSRLSSDVQRSGGPFHLQVGWSDAAALAKGSSHLYVIGRNKRLEIVEHAEIDRAMFERAEPAIRNAFDAVEAMIADPAKNCQYSEDLGKDDIVVT